ncbi:MAG: SPOR domain-containing protein [Bacteroidota bacterium]
MNLSLINFRGAYLSLLLHFLGAAIVLAQMPEADVRKRLDFIYTGQAERVRVELPSLEKQYPNDAGVAYLDAILTTDGEAAVKKFQAIVDQFPQNEWADDALYKVYQYYYSVGLYKTADQKFEQLKEQYPNSLYVVGTAKEQTPVAVQQEPVAEAKQADTSAQQQAAQPTVTEPAKTEAPDSTAAVSAVRKFAVQTGAFSTKRKAKKQIEFFSTINRTAIVTPKKIGEKTLYVVSIENFPSEQEARDFITELKLKYNIDSIIVAR